jgi:hypothetical protein
MCSPTMARPGPSTVAATPVTPTARIGILTRAHARDHDDRRCVIPGPRFIVAIPQARSTR